MSNISFGNHRINAWLTVTQTVYSLRIRLDKAEYNERKIQND